MPYSLSTDNSSAQLWTYFKRRTLDIVKPNLVFDQVGDREQLPKKYGNTIIFTKYRRLTPITAAGTEGTPPTLIAITSAQITAAVAQYKNGVGYTDALMAMGAPDGLEGIIEELVAENMARSLDTICRNQLASAIGTTQYGGGRTALSALGSSDTLTLPVARLAKLTLMANNVEPHKKGAYAFIGHPNTLHDMKTDTAAGGWIDVHKYNETGAKTLFNAEAGTVDDIRFMSTTLVNSSNSGTSGSAYAYTNMIFGYQPFGSVKLDGYSMDLIHHKPGSSGVSDPANELGSITWKAWYVTRYFGGNATVADPERGILVVTGRSS